MIVTAAVLPWPPAVVPELMGRAAGELEPLRHAADHALRELVAELGTQGAARVVVVAPGEPGEHEAAGELDFGDFGREVIVPSLDDAAPAAPAELPTPLMVCRYLVSRVTRDDAAATELWRRARWLTVDAQSAPALATELARGTGPTGLVVLVDGATSHGPKAPKAEDSRAGGFDDSVALALETGDRQRLAGVDLDLAHVLGADAAFLWPFLAEATDGATWKGELLFRGEPYGVGWTVALWRRG